MSDLSQAAKDVFVAAAARRKENGVRLKRICLAADAGQVEAFSDLFETWVQRWGKQKAVDCLIASLCDSEARYQDLLQLVKERRKKKNARALHEKHA